MPHWLLSVCFLVFSSTTFAQEQSDVEEVPAPPFNDTNTSEVEDSVPPVNDTNMGSVATTAPQVAPVPAVAPKQRRPRGPFDQGRFRFRAGGGGGGIIGGGGISIGVGVSYFVADGLSLDFDVDHSFTSNLNVTRVSPGVTYTFVNDGGILPFVGAFYRRWIDWGGTNQDSVGGQLGVAMRRTGIFLNVGLSYEKVLDCSGDEFLDCNIIAPILGLSAGF